MPACDWEVSDCQNCAAFMDLSPEAQAEVEAWAVNRLWLWTNQRFGACPVSYRPCRTSCGDGWPVIPTLSGGHFINLVCGSCGDNCSCGHVSEVILPGPIAEPVEILIDGVALDLCAVRVDDYNRLVRIDGGYFPTCQDVGGEPTDDGTWQVTYLQGEPVPPGGSLVAGVLACEYAKAVAGDGSCRLPKRLTVTQRQGLTVAAIDKFEGLDTGMTGIWEIDDWIMSAIKPPARSSVWSPDVPRHRQTTWTCGDSV